MSVIKKVAAMVKYPSETTEVILAIVLLAFGLYTMIPSEWLGTTSVYGNTIGKIIFGSLILAPAIPILTLAIKHNALNYQLSVTTRYRSLFFISVTYLYLAAIRVAFIGAIPIIWFSLIGLCMISVVAFLRLFNELA